MQVNSNGSNLQEQIQESQHKSHEGATAATDGVLVGGIDAATLAEVKAALEKAVSAEQVGDPQHPNVDPKTIEQSVESIKGVLGNQNFLALLSEAMVAMIETNTEENKAARQDRMFKITESLEHGLKAASDLKEASQTMLTGAVAGLAMGLAGTVVSIGASVASGVQTNKAGVAKTELDALQEGETVGLAAMNAGGARQQQGGVGAALDGAQEGVGTLRAERTRLTNLVKDHEGNASKLDKVGDIAGRMGGAGGQGASGMSQAQAQGQMSAQIVDQSLKDRSESEKGIQEDWVNRTSQVTSTLIQMLGDIQKTAMESVRSAFRS